MRDFGVGAGLVGMIKDAIMHKRGLALVTPYDSSNALVPVSAAQMTRNMVEGIDLKGSGMSTAI